MVTDTIRVDNPRGYTRGAVGQGWFLHPDGSQQDLNASNDVSVTVNED